jgi:hypothetical protein
MQKLKVLPRGGVLVPRHETIMSGRKEFIGRAYDPKAGEHGGGGFPVAEGVSPASPVEVPTAARNSPEYYELWMQYRSEVHGGALWPADAATAKACDTKYDPKFGGEFDAPASDAPSAPATDAPSTPASDAPSADADDSNPSTAGA